MGNGPRLLNVSAFARAGNSIRVFRQFLLRDAEKVSSEWALVWATHNVLKLYRACAG